MTSNADKTIALRFSASSETYDRSARAQPVVAERIMGLLDKHDQPERILEIGCGTGLLTEKLAARFPDTMIDAVDASKNMIEQARQRCAGNDRMRFTACDARDFSAGADYSLITSCSALHWMNPISEAVLKLSSLLKAGGLIVFGLMVEGTLEELHSARLRAAPGKPPMGRLPSVTEVKDALSAADLGITACREEQIVLHYPSASALLLSLHEQGVTGGSVSIAAAPLNRAELSRLMADYDRSYRADGRGVRATYNAACFSAVKK